MKLHFTRRAARDLAAIGEHLNAVSPASAVRVEASIQESFRNLLRFPLIGREQKTEGVRKMVTPRIHISSITRSTWTPKKLSF